METAKIRTAANGTRYVRLTDLSAEQRRAFQKYLLGAGLPVIEGEGSIAFEVDYLDFLYNRRADRD